MATRKYNTIEERVLAAGEQSLRRANDRRVETLIKKWIGVAPTTKESAIRLAVANDYVNKKKAFREASLLLERELYKSNMFGGVKEKPNIVT